MKHRNSLRPFLALAGSSLLAVGSASATDGTWNGISGNWSDTTDPDGVWVSGVPADSADSTAFFTGVNITANQTITLDSARTIGNITFTDATTSSHNLTISGANILTLDVTTGVPVINVTQSGRELAIESQIFGSDGLQKSGAGNLRLTGTNDFTGGIVIGNGRLIAGSDAALGATSNGITFTGTQGALLLPTGTFTLDSNRAITSQSGAMAVISRESINNQGTINIAGQLTGEGGFQFSTGYQLGSIIYNLSNSNNNFQGALRIGGDYTGVHTFTPSAVTLNMASLTDGAGSGNIQFGRGNNSSGNILTLNYTNAAASDLVLGNRHIELGSSVETAHISNSSTSYGIIINTDLLVSRAGNKTVRLSAVAGSNSNIFAGDIADGASAAIAIDKQGDGTWSLSGTNTYSGKTFVKDNTLVFQGAQAVSANTTIELNHTSGNSGQVNFLDDASGTITLGSGIEAYTNNATGSHRIFVGNNNTANGGTSSGTTIDSTFVVPTLNFTYAKSDTREQAINVTGANGYDLRINNVVLNNLALRTAGQTTRSIFNPTSAGTSISIGDITMADGNTGIANDGVPVLELSGTTVGNEVTGVISNASDYLTGQALPLTKAGSSTWTLSGDNTYTGATTVSGGTLVINGDQSAATGAVSVASGATLGGIGTVGGATTLSGILSPGNSPGTLTFGGDLTLNNGATYLFEAGDLTAVNGTLGLNDNWTLALGGGFQDGGSVTLFTYGALAGSPDLDPAFDLTHLGFTPGGSLSVTNDEINKAIVLTGISVVPEPSAALLGGLGLLALLRRRR